VSTVYAFSNGNTKVPLFEYQSGVSSCSCDPRSRAANCAVAVIVVAMWEQVSILWYRRYPARAIAPSKSRLMKVQSGTTWERALRIRSLIRLGGSEIPHRPHLDDVSLANVLLRFIVPSSLLANSIADYHYQRNELSLML